MELRDTFGKMLSRNWKDRLQAEYMQLVIRQRKLAFAIFEAENENPNHISGDMLALMKEEQAAMIPYKNILREMCKEATVSVEEV